MISRIYQNESLRSTHATSPNSASDLGAMISELEEVLSAKAEAVVDLSDLFAEHQ